MQNLCHKLYILFFLSSTLFIIEVMLVSDVVLESGLHYIETWFHSAPIVYAKGVEKTLEMPFSHH